MEKGTLQSFQATSNEKREESVGKPRTVDFLSGILEEDKVHLPLWQLTFVNGNGEVSVHSNDKHCSEHKKTADNLSLLWIVDLVDSGPVVDMVAEIAVTLEINLTPDTKLSQWRLSTELISTNVDVSLWNSKILVPTTAGADEDEGVLFFPGGYGHGYNNPVTNTGGQVSARYPSGGAAMQFMAIVNDPSYNKHNKNASTLQTDGLYVAALDLKGITKDIEYTTFDFKSKTHYDMNAEEVKNRNAHGRANSLWVVADHDPEARNNAHQSLSPRISFLSIGSTAENAGMPWSLGQKYELPYAVGVGVVSEVNDANGFPLWYQASQVYRDFIFPAAPWITSKISSRVPGWYKSNAVWLNTHWQCLDVFNNTGGDPMVVRERIGEIAQLLKEPSLLLHWYEWQQGPEKAPSKRYKFDTHYPDYFPPRGGGGGDLYKEVVQELLNNYSVYSFPYINGRIFDVDSDSFVNDDGNQYCIKEYPSPQLITMDSTQKPVATEESYGSGATFCVANPYTSYWQDKIVNTTMSLLDDWDSSGVYIDQIGASHPNDCFDASMGHQIGGGNYFSSGYNELLEQIDGRKKQNEQMIITEDCAESYMGNLQGNLILSTFRTSLAMNSAYAEGRASLQSYRRLVPAYPAVYGGYFIGMGAEWYRNDWEDENWLCSKLASQFVVGAQLGWFSVIGMSDPDFDDKCGPMGVGDLLLSDKHANFVKYMKIMTEARRKAQEYLLDGVLSAPPVLDPIPPVYVQNDESVSVSMPPLDYDSISKSKFALLEGDDIVSRLTILANNMNNYTYKGKVKLDKSGNRQHVKVWSWSVKERNNRHDDGHKVETISLEEATYTKHAHIDDDEDDDDDDANRNEWMEIEIEPRSISLIEQTA